MIARHPLEFVDHHQVVLVWKNCIALPGQDAAGEARRHAEVARLVVARVAGARLEERFAARLERCETLAVEDRGGERPRSSPCRYVATGQCR